MLHVCTSVKKDLEPRIVGQLGCCCIPIQPEMASVLMREHDVKGFRLGKVPMHFFFDAPSFVRESVRRLAMKTFHEAHVDNAGLFLQFPAHGGLVVCIACFDVTLWEIPVALWILEQQHRSKVDQHDAA